MCQLRRLSIVSLPIQFILTCIGLFLFSAAGSLLAYDTELVIMLGKYLQTIQEMAREILQPGSIIIRVGDPMDYKSYPIYPLFFQLFGYSFSLLLLAFFLAAGMSSLISYLFMFLPRKVYRVCFRLLDSLDSLPDVMIIVFIQLFIVWFFKKTDILLFEIYTLGDEKIYLLPIICLAIMPVAFLTKQFLFQLREEEEKPYVEYSYSKGFSKAYTIWVHLFRNVWIHFYYHIKPIFLLMLSNLLIIEILFNINGFMNVLLDVSSNTPSAFFIGMLMIYIPFFIVFTLGSVLLKKWLSGGEVSS
ncbi:ABC transporter permease subunit [Rossellomorea vietnamensis]|uniref:ABC transporter permease subunit n=1 Tax=Rossellomorea vietnamensis TaxID=218284 RepID=A0ACD4CC31_9BACI|nr:ABC transporter permease subunit [Rossellomorea vietnamensis]UXH46160.1 ABC transporter permease subunit [Rossellomorea vietnamensis]WQI97605.1 ABC transporter permease subunit [Rossellomorea vietnamensis]